MYSIFSLLARIEIFRIMCFIDFTIFLRNDSLSVLMMYIIMNKKLKYIVINLIEETYYVYTI